MDYQGIARALWTNLQAGGVAQGGSTITQQLVKNILVGNERSYERKLKEAALALRLERELSKDELLELFVNYIYLGAGNYGVEAAAQDAGVRAGRIHKHLVELLELQHGFRVVAKGHCLHARHAEARAVFGDQFQALCAGVAGEKFTVVLHLLRDVGSLAAGRGAEIEDAFAGPRVEGLHGKEGAGILHVEPALAEAAEGGQRGVCLEREDGVLLSPRAGDKIVFHALVEPPTLDEPGRVGLECVDANVRGRGCVVPRE